MKRPILILLALGISLPAVGCGDEVTSSGGDGGSGGATTSGGGNNTGGNTAGGGGQSETMGASTVCQACVADEYSNDAQCAMNIQTCDGDTACNDWKNCNEDCFNEDDTVACYTVCDETFPHDTTLSQPLLDCSCGACAGVCPATCADR